ncbi:gametocyte-specific factor 1-like [Nylanderia fulva]|uniref:gametocyte-specific factor 1-like n=1 Tax=Nylanderia fulva TaxID=613905 RepID=UPI0010FBAD64|nr:gametocyte-specific factor 1-like [Nylanderia fulva]
MYNSDSDEVMRCPYNKHHSISKSRFQRHLVKCEKNYPPNYMVICPYNAMHRSTKSEIGEHINTCPMRSTVEASYIQPLNMRDKKNLSKEYNSTSEIDSDIFSEEEEMRNLQKFPLSSKSRYQTNGFIQEGKMESFVSATNIGPRSLNHYNFLSDESTADHTQSIRQGRISSNHTEYYSRRFK